ncbi:MAG: signal peptidase I [Ktedonobacteraceae bacterium]
MNPELDFEKRFRLVREVIETIVLTVLMFLVIRFAVQNFNVDGTSMEPSLHNGELILVDKWTYLFHPPQRGDVIVFIAPPQPTLDYVKRIIGVPGDRITVDGINVYVDGVKLNETYVAAINQGNNSGSIIQNKVVPPNMYFVLGDDRIRSSDSRYWGFVPRQNIIGRAAIVYWPLKQDNNGFLPNVASVFTNVHQPGAAANAPGNDNLNVSADAILILLAPLTLSLFMRQKSKRRRSVDSLELHP